MPRTGRNRPTTAPGDPVAADGPLVIGRATAGAAPSDWFPGSIKQVQVFQRALTATQVMALL